MAKRTVGMQLIIFGGERIKNDLPGVLDIVAKAGYQAVETGFFADRVPGKQFKKMLDDRGLKHVGVHWDASKTEKLGPVIDWLAETGGTDIPMSDVSLAKGNLDLYKQRAAEVNKAGALAAKAGITLSYHNHDWEMRPQDGRIPLEVLYEALDPKCCQACVDVYWVRDGGGDPAAFVAKWAPRIRILHAKDSYLAETGKRSFCPVGSGVLDFPAIVKALGPSPCPWVVVEQDVPNPGQTAESCTQASRAYVRDTLKL